MGIVDEDIGRVRESTDIVAVISQYTQLKRVGQRWSGLCPFHTEKTPSFSVNAEEGFYYCFGCQVSGDAITFLREKEQLDFVGAVESLASRAGITLRYTDQNEGEGRRRQKRLLELTERVAAWYHDRLRTSPDAAAARAYLRGRGFTSDEVAHFRVGWAPDGWDTMARALDVSVADLEAAGLGFRNKAGRRQDFFRNRVLFPIIDERGGVVGFGGRKLPDGDGPKYQNSRDNALYNKSKVLYGLNWAKADAVNRGEIVVCEGYTDVIGMARAGIERAVATCGTALTEEHVRQLRRYARRIVLAYDADDAGQAASERIYAWERTHDLEVAVVAIPDGADPDELARTAPDQLRVAVEDARPFLAFRVARVLDAADLATPERRARAAEDALGVVAEHPDPLVRDQYVMELADRCRIDSARLREELERAMRRPRSSRSDEPPDDAPWSDEPLPLDPEGPAAGPGRVTTSGRPAPPVRDGVETESLRLMIHHRDRVEPFLDELLFSHPTVRDAYRLVAEHAETSEAIEAADSDVAALLRRLVVETSEVDMTDVLVRLATEVGRQVLAELESEARSSVDPLAFSESIRWLKVTLDQLRLPRPEVETLTQLLAWLTDRRRLTSQGDTG